MGVLAMRFRCRVRRVHGRIPCRSSLGRDPKRSPPRPGGMHSAANPRRCLLQGHYRAGCICHMASKHVKCNAQPRTETRRQRALQPAKRSATKLTKADFDSGAKVLAMRFSHRECARSGHCPTLRSSAFQSRGLRPMHFFFGKSACPTLGSCHISASERLITW